MSKILGQMDRRLNNLNQEVALTSVGPLPPSVERLVSSSLSNALWVTFILHFIGVERANHCKSKSTKQAFDMRHELCQIIQKIFHHNTNNIIANGSLRPLVNIHWDSSLSQPMIKLLWFRKIEMIPLALISPKWSEVPKSKGPRQPHPYKIK